MSDEIKAGDYIRINTTADGFRKSKRYFSVGKRYLVKRTGGGLLAAVCEQTEHAKHLSDALRHGSQLGWPFHWFEKVPNKRLVRR